jgi:hypothetical protein
MKTFRRMLAAGAMTAAVASLALAGTASAQPSPDANLSGHQSGYQYGPTALTQPADYNWLDHDSNHAPAYQY